jgi:hypothetical protein
MLPGRDCYLVVVRDAKGLSYISHHIHPTALIYSLHSAHNFLSSWQILLHAEHPPHLNYFLRDTFSFLEMCLISLVLYHLTKFLM